MSSIELEGREQSHPYAIKVDKHINYFNLDNPYNPPFTFTSRTLQLQTSSHFLTYFR